MRSQVSRQTSSDGSGPGLRPRAEEVLLEHTSPIRFLALCCQYDLLSRKYKELRPILKGCDRRRRTSVLAYEQVEESKWHRVTVPCSYRSSPSCFHLGRQRVGGPVLSWLMKQPLLCCEATAMTFLDTSLCALRPFSARHQKKTRPRCRE